MHATPILDLGDSATITSLFSDPAGGGVFIGLSDGRILRLDSVDATSSLAGARGAYAYVKDGFGNESGQGILNFAYRLHRMIIDVDSGESVTRRFSVNEAFSATTEKSVSAVFTSPVLWGGSDFGFWESLSWNMTRPAGTRVELRFRTGSTANGVAFGEWTALKLPLDSGTDMAAFNATPTTHKYVQLQVIMSSESPTVTPVVSEVTASFRTKFAVYFFTKKFVLDRDSNLSTGIATASVATPLGTEVKFGLCDKNSNDWDDYTEIELDKFFALPESVKSRFKVGIKFVSHNDHNAPSVDEFALMFGGEKDNYINRI